MSCLLFTIMDYKLFISHSTKDRLLAEAITELLSKITLKLLDPWFSSDTRSNKGLNPGLWFNQIVNQISGSKALIAIMTPNSINSPWIYYESGIAQALEDCDIIPICVNLNKDNLPFPLKFYQAYQLSDYSSLKEFVAKLLGICGVHFDEEVSKPFITKAIKTFANINFGAFQNIGSPVDIQSMFEDLRNHIDKRFIDYLPNPNSDKVVSERLLYTIPIEIPFLIHNSIQYEESINVLIYDLIFLGGGVRAIGKL